VKPPLAEVREARIPAFVTQYFPLPLGPDTFAHFEACPANVPLENDTV
jgi:hypothetical protein